MSGNGYGGAIQINLTELILDYNLSITPGNVIPNSVKDDVSRGLLRSYLGLS